MTTGSSGVELEEARAEAQQCRRSIEKLGFKLQYEDHEATRHQNEEGWSVWIEPEATGLKVRIYKPNRELLASFPNASIRSMKEWLPDYHS